MEKIIHSLKLPVYIIVLIAITFLALQYAVYQNNYWQAKLNKLRYLKESQDGL